MPLIQSSAIIINVIVIKLITIHFLSSLRHGVVNCVELAPFTFSTTSGVLQGLQLDVGTRKVIQLLGVPYAKPPLGSLRYMKPLEYTSADTNINTAYDATYQRPMCIQFLKLADAGVPEFMRPRTGQSEDCLYMDIYIGFDRRLPPSGASTRPAYEPPRENTRPAAVSGPLPINFSGHQPLPQNSTLFVRPYNPSSSSSVDSFGNVIPRAIRDYFDGQRQTNLLGARSAALQQPRGGDTGSKLKPIMVFFHGGGFVFGSGSMYNASFLALGGDVIVVVPNYRLGPLGFMSFASDELPGNAGLWDQHFVLQWVRANALALGGDPNRVTIFGESSGAMSTSAHCLSPMSKIPDALGSGTLFRRAIMQSGIITNNLVEHSPERIRAKAENFANALQCARAAAPADGGGGVSPSTLPLLLECLQQVSVRQIRDVGRHGAYNFGIVVDGLFLPADPERMLREGRFHKEIDLLIGFNSDEGSVALANIRSDFELPDTNFEQAVANTLRSTVLRPYTASSSSSATGTGDAASSAAAARAIESIAADLVAYEYFGDHADLIEQISAEMHRRGQALNSLSTILGDATDTVYSAGAGLVEADSVVGRGTLHGGETTSDVLAGLDRRGFGRTLFPSPDIAAKQQQHIFNTSLTSLEAQTLRNLRRLMDITKDSLIEAPAVRFANMAANRGALAYMYVFSHEPTFEFLRKPPYLVRGAAHAEELPFLFGMVLRDFAATDAEQLLSVLMIDAWTNFAKFGNPAFSPDIAPNLPDWLPWRTNSAREHYFLDFDVNVKPSSLKQNVNSRKHYLWNDLLPRFVAAMSDCASGNEHSTIIVENSPASVPIFLPASATGGSRHFFEGEQPQNSASSKYAVADIGRQLHARSNEQQIATYFEQRKNAANLPDSVRNGNFSTSTTLKPSVTTTSVHVASIVLNAANSTTPVPSAASTNAPNNNNSADPSSSSVITCVQNFTLPDPLHVSSPSTSSLLSGGLFLVGRYVTVAQADLLVCGLCALLIVTVLSAVIVALLWCCCWECGALTRSQCNKNQKLLLLESQNNDNNLHQHHQQCRHLHECSANRHSNLTSSTMIAAFGVGGGEPPLLPKINKRPFGIRTVPIVPSASGESHKNRSALNISSSEWCGAVSAVKKRYPWV